MIDLHIHTTASDGTDSPSAIVEKSINIGLKAISITDHDTVKGIEEAVKAAKPHKDFFVIPGIELSAIKFFNGKKLDLHILGYGINYKDAALITKTAEIAAFRIERNKKISAALREYAGSKITVEKLKERFGDPVLTRANFAYYLTEEGIVENKDEAFSKYLDKGKPCYFPKKKITVEEAVEIINSAGGKAVLAHPVMIKEIDKPELNGLIPSLKDSGIEGLECYYSNNKPKDTAAYIEIAKKNGLFCTGGSDYHGKIKRINLGTGFPDGLGYEKLSVPDELSDRFLTGSKKSAGTK